MPDLALIQGAITGLKTVGDIAKGILELKTFAEVQGKVIDLQSAILAAQSSALAAQSEQASMINRIRDLEEEIARIEAWEETKQRYKLVTPFAGAFFYALKREPEPAEPPHWICATCYEKRLKRIIQMKATPLNRNITFLVCPECKTEITMPLLSHIVAAYAD
jgi:hypothetical protein